MKNENLNIDIKARMETIQSRELREVSKLPQKRKKKRKKKKSSETIKNVGY